jgi:hypothetical protein
MKMELPRQLISLTGAALLLLCAAGGEAIADSPVETAVKDFVAAVDASPAWTAAYRELSYDAAADTAVISDLAIATTAGELRVDFKSISLTGYAASADGSFSAKSIKVDGGSIGIGPVKLTISDAAFQDLAVPAVAGGSYDPEKPYSSLMPIYSGILRASLGQSRIGSLSLVEIIQGVTSRITFADIAFSGLHDGKMASISSGAMKLESPSPDPLVTMTSTSAESADVDLGAMFHVLDPAAYAGGTGDLVWHQVLGHSSYKGTEVDLPGVSIAVGDLTMDGLKARQPKHGFAPFLDAIMAHPEKSDQAFGARAGDEGGLIDCLSAFSIERYGVSRVKVQASGLSQFDIGDFHIADYSIESIGEIAVEGLSGSIEGQGSIKIGRVALGDIKLADPEVWRSALQAGGNTDAGPPIDQTRLFPKIGFAEARGIDIQALDVFHIVLDKARADLGNYVGFFPTKVDAGMSGLDLPVAAMDPESRAILARLGYDHISLNYRLKSAWDAHKNEVAIDDFQFRAANIGAIAASGRIGGVTGAFLENPGDPDAAPDFSLISGKLTFSDESIVGKGLDLLAEKMKAPPDKFRRQFVDALPFLLSMSAVSNPALMTTLRQSGLLPKLTPALKTFVGEPGGSLTVTMAPSTPVGLAAATEAADKAPETLINLLNVSFSAAAGKPATAPADKAPGQSGDATKELRPTIAP